MGPTTFKTAGIILAGGKNRRMGRDKALLRLGSDLIIEKIIQVLTKVTEEIIIVANSPEKYAEFSHQVYPDLIPGCGPLGGIYTGLNYASGDWCLVAACDTPFISHRLISYMQKVAASHQAVVPCYQGFWAPLFALYHKDCRPAIEHQLQAGLYKTQDLYRLIDVRALKETEMAAVEPRLDRVFFNINTPADLETARLLK